MSIYWYLNGLIFESKIEKLKNTSHEALQAMVLNEHYNSFLSRYENYNEDEQPIDPTISNGKPYGKRLPYQGWFWRHVNFYKKNIPVGIGETFKGFMENNKWSYPEGKLTEDQFNQVMEIIDKAIKFSEAGGEIFEIRKNTVGELEKLWPLFQEFKIVVEY